MSLVFYRLLPACCPQVWVVKRLGWLLLQP